MFPFRPGPASPADPSPMTFRQRMTVLKKFLGLVASNQIARVTGYVMAAMDGGKRGMEEFHASRRPAESAGPVTAIPMQGPDMQRGDPIVHIPVVRSLTEIGSDEADAQIHRVNPLALESSSINWAVLRIAGIRIRQLDDHPSFIFMVRDFRIGGSPNLFMHEGWGFADNFGIDGDALRANPILIAPNIAMLELIALYHGTKKKIPKSVSAEVSVLVQTLRDDVSGATRMTGTYSR